jgi:c-di-GMP-binding flagellar brake protein YcgR
MQSDKRQFKRIPKHLSLKYKIITLGSYVEKSVEPRAGSTSENISEGGILVLADENIPLGTFMEVEISVKGEEFPLYIKGRVRRVEEIIPGKKYDLGIMFSSTTEDDKKILQRIIGDSEMIG